MCQNHNRAVDPASYDTTHFVRAGNTRAGRRAMRAYARSAATVNFFLKEVSSERFQSTYSDDILGLGTMMFPG
jgi:hypothetical protein